MVGVTGAGGMKMGAAAFNGGAAGYAVASGAAGAVAAGVAAGELPWSMLSPV